MQFDLESILHRVTGWIVDAGGLVGTCTFVAQCETMTRIRWHPPTDWTDDKSHLQAASRQQREDVHLACSLDYPPLSKLCKTR